MEQYQHEIVTAQGIAIMVTRDDVAEEIYTIQSEDERFLEIFNMKSFQLKPGDAEMENAIIGQVVQYNQPAAMEILEGVKKVI
jgi:hypothetical protein